MKLQIILLIIYAGQSRIYKENSVNFTKELLTVICSYFYGYILFTLIEIILWIIKKYNPHRITYIASLMLLNNYYS